MMIVIPAVKFHYISKHGWIETGTGSEDMRKKERDVHT
jgi:hypothetical protein